MKILVVAAHPDDETLGCGATVARLAKEGHEVYAAILGEGGTSRAGGTASTLKDQAELACKRLGITQLFTFGLPDNQFDSIPLLKVIQPIEKLIEQLKPQRIFTHHGGDLNVDHRITYQAVLTATRPIGNHPVREVLAFEIPSSTEWAFQRVGPAFQPNFFFNVSGFIDRKIEAMSAYSSETRQSPHPRSEPVLRAIATRWGSVVGCESAEAFELIRRIE